MSAPDHALEHESLIQMLAKSIDVPGTKIANVILVTIGHDGRPCIGSDMETPERVFHTMYQLLANAQHVENVEEVKIPKGN